jgi:hypothetical protein
VLGVVFGINPREHANYHASASAHGERAFFALMPDRLQC